MKKISFHPDVREPINIKCHNCKYPRCRKKKRKFTGCKKCFMIVCQKCIYNSSKSICQKCTFSK